MYWTYKGHNNHLNEDDFECSECKRETGFPTYVDPNKSMMCCQVCNYLHDELALFNFGIDNAVNLEQE